MMLPCSCALHPALLKPTRTSCQRSEPTPMAKARQCLNRNVCFGSPFFSFFFLHSNVFFGWYWLQPSHVPLPTYNPQAPFHAPTFKAVAGAVPVAFVFILYVTHTYIDRERRIKRVYKWRLSLRYMFLYCSNHFPFRLMLKPMAAQEAGTYHETLM